jgi:hypothetical protein
MLNWRRDPDYERRMNAKRIEIEQIRTETEQLKRENARLAKLIARDDVFSALIKQHCFPDDSSSS